MPIRDWPANERPREKMLQRGADALSDAELLAVLLRTGVTGCSAVDLARDLLEQFDGLRGLLEASHEELCAVHGLGPAKALQLAAGLALGQRHLLATLARGSPLSSPAATRDYLVSVLRHRSREVFLCLFLDTRHRVIASEELFHGTIDAASVHPREVVKCALSHNAAAVIAAHNHPSGVSEPSAADHAVTDRLRSALALVDIRLLDHFIVGEGPPISLAERGLL